MANMSYIHKPAPEPLEYRTLMQLFDIHANSHPDREAFVLYNLNQRSSHTFEKMQKESLHLAASFLRLGWKRGQSVVLMIPSRIEFLLCYMALLRIGVNVMLLPSSGKPVEEVIAILRRYDCHDLILCLGTEKSFNDQLMGYLKSSKESNTIVLIDSEKTDTFVEEYSKFHDILKSGENLDVTLVLKEQEKVQLDDLAVVVFTSGSTGEPKAVQHTHHMLTNGTILSVQYGYGIQVNRGKKLARECRVFNDRPFYWAGCLFGGLNSVLALGSTLLAAPPIKTVKECDIDFLLRLLENERCTNALFMAYIVVDIANHSEAKNYDLSHLETILCAGQPMSLQLLNKLELILPKRKVFYGYGLSEVMPFASELVRLGSTGDDYEGMDPAPPIEVKIIDGEQNLVPVGQVGEVCGRSPCTFLGYLNNPQATAKAKSNTGWVHTGDMGLLNDKGKLELRGRRADMIKRATVTIFPAEIERVLVKYPEVKDIVVVGVPDVRLYEELCACVIPKKGSTLESSVAEFEDWMSSQWTPDEQGLTLKPKYLVIMEEFPKMKTGKSDRKATRIAAAERLGIELE